MNKAIQSETTKSARRAVPVLAGAAVMLATGAAKAALVYDGDGFELPRFVTGVANAAQPLTGQDSAPVVGQGPWVQDSGASTANVQTNSPDGGLQSIEVQRVSGATGDTRWWVSKPVTPTAALPVVSIDFDMNVNVAPLLTAGPLFGIEAYDASGATPKLIGGLMLDAAQGTVLYDLTGTGAHTSTSTFLSRNAYHHFTLSADFTSKAYSVYIDGTPLHTEAFVDTTATSFSYAPIAALASALSTETGKAYFDNYTITQSAAVPEPAAAAMLVLGGAALLRRRRA